MKRALNDSTPCSKPLKAIKCTAVQLKTHFPSQKTRREFKKILDNHRWYSCTYKVNCFKKIILLCRDNLVMCTFFPFYTTSFVITQLLSSFITSKPIKVVEPSLPLGTTTQITLNAHNKKLYRPIIAESNRKRIIKGKFLITQRRKKWRRKICAHNL